MDIRKEILEGAVTMVIQSEIDTATVRMDVAGTPAHGDVVDEFGLIVEIDKEIVIAAVRQAVMPG
jgi:hypothetical protein